MSFGPWTSDRTVGPRQHQGTHVEDIFAKIEECQRLRGWLINSFAQIEFLIGDLPCRAWEIPEYAEMKQPVSIVAKNRMKQTRSLLEAPGPLASYAERLVPLLDRFERYDQARNFIAHGFCSFDFVPRTREVAMRFRCYVPRKGQPPELLELYMLPGELGAARDEWVPIAEQVVAICHEIYLRFGLENGGPVAERVVYRPDFSPGSRST